MVELLPSKQAVASSNLVSRSVGPIAQWQSNRLITGRFLVRVQVGPLALQRILRQPFDRAQDKAQYRFRIKRIECKGALLAVPGQSSQPKLSTPTPAEAALLRTPGWRFDYTRRCN